MPDNAPAMVMASLRLRIRSPLFTTAPEPVVPVVPPSPTCSVPAETVVTPEYVLAPDRVNVPEPDFVSAPVPEIVAVKATSSLRLWPRVPLFTMADDASEPEVPPLPTCKVPASMVVEPENVWLPVSVSVLAPSFRREPEPDTADPKDRLSLRLKTSAPLLTTAPEPNAPEVPPLPTCNVPAEIVVTPEYVLLPDKTMVPAPVFVRKLAWGVGHAADGPLIKVPLTSKSTAATPSATSKVVPARATEPRPTELAEMTEEFAPPLTVTLPRRA